MRNLILILLNFICISAFSQNYRVIYKLTYKPDSLKERTLVKDMLLEVKKNQTEFYSYDFYKKDSAYKENIKQGKEDYKPMFDSNFSIIKNESTISKLHNFPPNSTLYRLNEPKENFDWKISNETKTFNNYLCQKAYLNFKGRSWTAWFTRDIPLNFGPYVFEGLPGAIIYMEDSRKDYIFELSALKLNSFPNNSDFSDKSSTINISKKDFIKIILDRYNDPYKEIRSDDTLIENSDGSLSKPNINKITKEKQDFIKEHNNPIELSEAIKYP